MKRKRVQSLIFTIILFVSGVVTAGENEIFPLRV